MISCCKYRPNIDDVLIYTINELVKKEDGSDTTPSRTSYSRKRKSTFVRIEKSLNNQTKNPKLEKQNNTITLLKDAINQISSDQKKNLCTHVDRIIITFSNQDLDKIITATSNLTIDKSQNDLSTFVDTLTNSAQTLKKSLEKKMIKLRRDPIINDLNIKALLKIMKDESFDLITGEKYLFSFIEKETILEMLKTPLENSKNLNVYKCIKKINRYKNLHTTLKIEKRNKKESESSIYNLAKIIENKHIKDAQTTNISWELDEDDKFQGVNIDEKLANGIAEKIQDTQNKLLASDLFDGVLSTILLDSIDLLTQFCSTDNKVKIIQELDKNFDDPISNETKERRNTVIAQVIETNFSKKK